MSHRIKFFIFIFITVVCSPSLAQEKKTIALEDIWARPTFRVNYMQGFQWMKDEKTYSALVENNILKFDVLTGNVISFLFSNTKDISIDEYSINDAEDKLLIASESEEIYRHSFRANYNLYDLKTKSLKPIYSKKISYATFSPDGSKIAFVSENNLFYYDNNTSKATQITDNGKINSIINGSTDWVYEEEFSFTKGFSWSPDSKKIAFYTFDETEVREYDMQTWGNLYPEDYKFKYPKAGEKNSVVSIQYYDLSSHKTTLVNTGNEKDIYLPRMEWTKNIDVISIQRLNRLQNNFELLHANVVTGEVKTVYKESNNSYVEITDDLTYLNNGKHFIISSEKDGYRHLYLYDMNGNQVSQITKGSWEVDKFLGVQEDKGMVYYTSTKVSPMERHLYSSDLSGKKHKQLTETKGTHEIEMSPGFKYFVDVFSTLTDAPLYTLNQTSNGKQVKVLQHNDELKTTLESYQISKPEFFQFTTEENISLNGFMIKPPKFDATKKYPVLIYVYGGPGIQTVTDSWKGPNYFWFQMIAQQGYVVVSFDGRGTGGRGADFKKITQNKLGKYETQDLIQTAKFLGRFAYVDKSRIGIFGWSFGGYLSSLGMTVGAEFFKAGIAVAPVISWRFYDTIYTERYLGLPQDNAAGYDENSPLSHAEKLKGSYLLIHGTADDNVHLQNSIAMEDALIKANKQFQAFHYPDKNHGIYGGITRYHLYKMMTDFILNKL